MTPLMADRRRQEELARASRDWPSWILTPRQLGDLELILNGGYAPLDRFMTRADVEACVREMRLSDGAPFPAPVVLDVSDACAGEAAATSRLVLRDAEGVAVAVLEVQDSWKGERSFVGGPVTGLQLPHHHDAAALRLTPAEVADRSRRSGWNAAVAFPTAGFIHRAEYQAARAAMERADGGLVVMALADPEGDDADRYVRVRCHEAAMRRYPADRALLWLVPLPSRTNPIAEALLAAVVARNAGCTHILLPPPSRPRFDVASEHEDAAAGSSVDRFARQLNLTVLQLPAAGTIVGPNGETMDADAEARLLADGERLPDWYTFPEVAEQLAVRHPPRHRRGFTVFFSGLSGSGKSTIANLVRLKLLERSGRSVTLLDGDLVRQHLSSELGFSRQHRDLNIRRIAFVASEITKHGGIAICAPIAPYESGRHEARRTVEAFGGFVLVFVDTPVEVCEARDRKGLYAKARAGVIAEFTGVSDVYEAPSDADLVVRTADESPEQAAERILELLERRGYLMPAGGAWER